MARTFNGSNQYIRSNWSVGNVQPVTLAAWFNTTDVSTTQTIFWFGDKIKSNNFFALDAIGNAAGDPIRFFVRADNAVSASTTTGYTSGAWHHACGVSASATDHRAFIDGGSKGTSSDSSVPFGTDSLCVGRSDDSSPGNYFTGSVAEAAIWEVALSDEEVALLAKGLSPLLIRPESLIFYTPLIRDNDRDLIEGLTMTPVNSPTVDDHPRIIYPSAQILSFEAAAAGGGTTGTAAATLSAITGSSSGSFTSTFTGSAGAGLASLTAESTGVLSYSGSASAAVDAITADGSGSFGAGFTATAAADLAAITSDASGVLIYSGSGDASLTTVIATSSGVLVYEGSATGDLDPVSGSGSGGFSSADFSGSGVANLAQIAASASGVLSYTGTAEASLSALTASASGLFSAAEFSGSAVALMEAINGAATGSYSLEFNGTGVGQLAIVTSSASGALVYAGTAEGLLESVIALASESAPSGSIVGASNLIFISRASNLRLISN